jgi:hypothetical protein
MLRPFGSVTYQDASRVPEKIISCSAIVYFGALETDICVCGVGRVPMCSE